MCLFTKLVRHCHIKLRIINLNLNLTKLNDYKKTLHVQHKLNFSITFFILSKENLVILNFGFTNAFNTIFSDYFFVLFNKKWQNRKLSNIVRKVFPRLLQNIKNSLRHVSILLWPSLLYVAYYIMHLYIYIGVRICMSL